MQPSARGLAVTHVVRLVLAVGAVAVETSMVAVGSRPGAELEGLLVPLGLLAGAVTLPYLVVTITALVALVRARGGVRRTVGLGVADLVLGVVLVSGLVRAAVLGDPTVTSPLLWGVVPLALGVTTLTLARAARRTASRPTP